MCKSPLNRCLLGPACAIQEHPTLPKATFHGRQAVDSFLLGTQPRKDVPKFSFFSGFSFNGFHETYVGPTLPSGCLPCWHRPSHTFPVCLFQQCLSLHDCWMRYCHRVHPELLHFPTACTPEGRGPFSPLLLQKSSSSFEQFKSRRCCPALHS